MLIDRATAGLECSPFVAGTHHIDGSFSAIAVDDPLQRFTGIDIVERQVGRGQLGASREAGIDHPGTAIRGLANAEVKGTLTGPAILCYLR